MKSNIVICGAGIAGIAAAYFLSLKNKHSNIVLIDKSQPMSLTTSMSGENYRDYWPIPAMTEFISHSINLMRDISLKSDNETFALKQTGYDFISEQSNAIFESSYTSDDAIHFNHLTDKSEIAKSHPYLAKTINQVVHVRDAGSMNVNALGSYMLKKAKQAGVKLKQSLISDIQNLNENGFELSFKNESSKITCSKMVICTGPFCNHLASMLNVDLPLKNYLQRKFVIPDSAKIIPRNMPFTIFSDSQKLCWNDEEKALISTDSKYKNLLQTFPAGLHIKPEGQTKIKLGWAYNRNEEQPSWETSNDNQFVEIVLRGAARFIPALEQYLYKIPTPVTQYAGYYTRTEDNLPLIGRLELDNVYVIGGLSGYGTMSACAAGELLTSIMNNEDLPSYANYFDPLRSENTELMSEIQNFNSDGQL